MDGEAALEPGGAPAQTAQAAPSYRASQSRLASLERRQQLPEAARALQSAEVPFAADAVQPAGGACEAAAAGRADLLAEELTCILEFLNAQVGRTHVRLIRGVCVC